jgi:hypothetical protein
MILEKDRIALDNLKALAVAITERICQLEMLVCAGQNITALENNSCSMAKALTHDLKNLFKGKRQ